MSDVSTLIQNAGALTTINSPASQIAGQMQEISRETELSGPAKSYFELEQKVAHLLPEIEVVKAEAAEGGPKPKVTLCMIVKNEERVIERCLSSVLPLIDYWVIVDTGSTDSTKEKIKNFMTALNKPGKLYSRPWTDFSDNRTEALILARPEAEYSLMIDADEIIEYDAAFDPTKFRDTLTKDLYNVFAFYGNTKYHRPQLTSNKVRYQYLGVLHEFLVGVDEIKDRDFAPFIQNRPIQDGARSANPKKYADDALLLEKTLKEKGSTLEENMARRYMFYLAQSYRDSQQWEKSLECYKKRASMEGWAEEVFFSLYQAGRIMEIINDQKKGTFAVDEIVTTYFQAYQKAPWRAETLWCAARICRMYCRFDQGYAFAKAASRIQYPNGALFVTQHVYDWGVWDELAVCGFWSGHYRDSVIANHHLLSEGKMPQDNKGRIETNYRLAMDLLMNEGG